MTPNEAPNHALQRTGSAVTAPVADHLRLSVHRQVPRPLRLSLSLGSLERQVTSVRRFSETRQLLPTKDSTALLTLWRKA